tara:strand:+ start:643 stop:888 length:246 start_codon:yes stop_codon:yes gene_type:complete
MELNKEQMEDTLLELIEIAELTEFQLDYILKWLSGNGYVKMNKNIKITCEVPYWNLTKYGGFLHELEIFLAKNGCDKILIK